MYGMKNDFHKSWDIKMFLIIIYKKVFKDFVKFVLSYAQFKHTLINNNLNKNQKDNG